MDRQVRTPIAVATLSHHEASATELERARFPDEPAFLKTARDHFRGVLLLQTCNRVEILVQGSRDALSDFLVSSGRKDFRLCEGEEALGHLLLLAAGMDSMIVGEDQILGQMKAALAMAKEAGASSNVIEICVDKAVHVGIQVRQRTNINRGAVSIGSAAVRLAENLLGGLAEKHILVIGSGEMGMLVAQALSARGLSAIYVANRTYERAVALARKIGGRAVNLKDLYHYIQLSDVVISCTSAPHPVIHREPLREAMKERCWPLEERPRPIIIIDIAQPRDVEEGAGDIGGVSLFSIDDLRIVSENNLKERKAEAERAREYIGGELGQFVSLVNRAAADDTLSLLYTWAEAIRVRERDRAVHRLAGDDPRASEVIDDLTRVMVKKLLSDATLAIRECAERGEIQAAEAMVRAITRGDAQCLWGRGKDGGNPPVE
ncbi:MAG TPA: glutamyl-tRNA reductase [Methanomicrobiales archaeon]|jgi:glutamyl-tRNA reductase|nr:glutamyl-tRNA reductase [Methanomicrobiales archaeon]